MRKGEATRMAILDQAVTTARFTGLSGLTIGTLADRTGLSKSGLYAHFKSKETLQLATMDRNRERFIAEVIRPALGAPRGEERLRALVENWMRWYDHPGGCLFLAAATEFDDYPGPLRDRMVADEHDLLDSMRQVLGTLVTAGQLRPDADVDQLVQEVFGILLGYNWMSRILSDPDAAGRAWTAVDRILDSLRPLSPEEYFVMAGSRLKKSTIVRIIKGGFRLAEITAPNAGARRAAALWFRIPGRRRSVIPVAAQTFELDADGTTVRGYDWGSGPPVYLQHGWGGCVGDLDTIAAMLVAHGHRVIAVDGPSHGHSDPGPFGADAGSPVHLSAALSAAIDKFGAPHAVVAHSLGCLAAMIALRDRGAPHRLVMVAPFIGGPVFAKRFADQLGVGPRTYERFVELVERRVDRPMSYFDVASARLACPTLIVHDRRDRATPFEHGEAIAAAWPNAHLTPTENLGHLRILRHPEVVGLVTRFVRE